MGARPHYKCLHCGSTDKERNAWNVLSSVRGKDVLHIAPEKATKKLLATRNNYVCGDKFDGHERYADGRYGNDALNLDLTNLPFEDNSFDVVVANHVLEHIPGDAKALSEIRRVLRPTGFAVLEVPVTHLLESSLEGKEGDNITNYGQIDHVRVYSHSDFIGRVAAAGFVPSVQKAALNSVDGREFVYVAHPV